MKLITPTVHGYLDYLTVVVFLLAPKLLGLEGLPALLSWTLAGVHLALTLVTDFPLGWRPWLPFLDSRMDRKNCWSRIGPRRVPARFFPGELGIWLLPIHGAGDYSRRLVDRLFRRDKTSA